MHPDERVTVAAIRAGFLKPPFKSLRNFGSSPNYARLDRCEITQGSLESDHGCFIRSETLGERSLW